MLRLLKLDPGTVLLSRYRLVRQLGSGGNGSVHLVEDLQLRRLLAMKVLHLWSDQLQNNENSLKRFEREAQSLSRLIHPNIIQVYSFGELIANIPYMVMEYAEGESLKELIARRGALPCNEAIDIALQICSALDFAHAIGVIHRDLKPENVMLISETGKLPVESKSAIETASSSIADTIELGSVLTAGENGSSAPGSEKVRDTKLRAKILDFGLCRQTGEGNTLTETGLLIGSVCYMSPEQCIGDKVDQRTDIYSFACVLYEMITGSPPFYAENSVAVLLKHQYESIPSILKQSPRSGLPVLLDSVIARASAKNKNNRYQSFSELKIALEEIADMKNSSVFKRERESEPPLIRLKPNMPLIAAVCSGLLALTLAFLFLTGEGNVFLAMQIQKSLDAPKASKALVWIHKAMLSARGPADAKKLVEQSSSNTSIYSNWPFRQRMQLLEQYKENYLVARYNDEAFSLSLASLHKLLSSLRSKPVTQDYVMPVEEEQALAALSKQLYEQNHTKKQWKEISELLELHGGVFVKWNPGYLLWPAALRARAMAKLYKQESRWSVEILSKMYVQSAQLALSTGEDKLMFSMVNSGIELAHKHELHFDEHELYSILCTYYLRTKDMMKARQALAKVERICTENRMLLSGAEAGALQSLRDACATKPGSGAN